LGVEFQAVLIPRDNTVRPDGAAVLRLIAALRQAHFLAGAPSMRTKPLKSSGKQVQDLDIAALESGEFIAWWSVNDHLKEALTHPIAPEPRFDDEGGYYELELRFSDDLVAAANESVDPLDAACTCGNALEYWPQGDDDLYYAARIRRTCPSCSRAFRPQDKETTIRDGITGAESPIMGGLTYRFAVVIDCGKSWPQDSDSMPRITAEFRRTCEAALGLRMYEVSYFD
jgi:hypothetical protein